MTNSCDLNLDQYDHADPGQLNGLCSIKLMENLTLFYRTDGELFSQPLGCCDAVTEYGMVANHDRNVMEHQLSKPSEQRPRGDSCPLKPNKPKWALRILLLPGRSQYSRIFGTVISDLTHNSSSILRSYLLYHRLLHLLVALPALALTDRHGPWMMIDC